MIKPSELTPPSADLLPAGDRRCLRSRRSGGGDRRGGGRPGLSSLPFDHLLFTGSTAVGREVYKAAAANLVPVTLELGGKSPVILCDDYPLAKAARSIAFGKFLNAGQTCIAPDYVLVPEGQGRSAGRGAAGGGAPGLSPTRRRPRLFGRDQRAPSPAAARCHRGGAGSGATVLSHGEDEAAAAGKVAPTIVLGAPEETILASEEIFGPVLPIVPYRPARPGDRLRQQSRPAAGALLLQQGRGIAAPQVLERTVSGGATINGTLLHIAQESLPFGGVGPSGIGAYHGLEGFKRFSHARGVFKAGRSSPSRSWVRPGAISRGRWPRPC
jgi:coniferyl-aldehyde dehydrogenase